MQKMAFLQLFKRFEQVKQKSITLELYPNLSIEDPKAIYPKHKIKYIFETLLTSDIWLVLRTWETKENFRQQLENCGLTFLFDHLETAKMEDGLVDYDLFRPTYVFYTCLSDQSMLQKIAHGIIHNEIGLNPYLNAGAYFINFTPKPFLLNLPDDRIIELVFSKEDEDFFCEKYSYLKDKLHLE